MILFIYLFLVISHLFAATSDIEIDQAIEKHKKSSSFRRFCDEYKSVCHPYYRFLAWWQQERLKENLDKTGELTYALLNRAAGFGGWSKTETANVNEVCIFKNAVFLYVWDQEQSYKHADEIETSKVPASIVSIFNEAYNHSCQFFQLLMPRPITNEQDPSNFIWHIKDWVDFMKTHKNWEPQSAVISDLLQPYKTSLLEGLDLGQAASASTLEDSNRLRKLLSVASSMLHFTTMVGRDQLNPGLFPFPVRAALLNIQGHLMLPPLNQPELPIIMESDEAINSMHQQTESKGSCLLFMLRPDWSRMPLVMFCYDGQMHKFHPFALPVATDPQGSDFSMAAMQVMKRVPDLLENSIENAKYIRFIQYLITSEVNFEQEGESFDYEEFMRIYRAKVAEGLWCELADDNLYKILLYSCFTSQSVEDFLYLDALAEALNASSYSLEGCFEQSDIQEQVRLAGNVAAKVHDYGKNPYYPVISRGHVNGNLLEVGRFLTYQGMVLLKCQRMIQGYFHEGISNQNVPHLLADNVTACEFLEEAEYGCLKFTFKNGEFIKVPLTQPDKTWMTFLKNPPVGRGLNVNFPSFLQGPLAEIGPLKSSDFGNEDWRNYDMQHPDPVVAWLNRGRMLQYLAFKGFIPSENRLIVMTELYNSGIFS